MKSLKENNRKKLVLYAIMHFVVFACVLNDSFHAFEWGTVVKALITSAAANGAIALAQILFSGLISDEIKASLVFWRIKNPLPGTQAFSSIAKSDPRIDLVRLKKRYGAFPNDPKEQNLLWYRIYRQHKDEMPVLDAHGDFLLTREMTCMSIAFFIILPLLGLAQGLHWWLVLPYAGGLFLIYLVTATAGRHYGRRLVANVLAIEAAK
jgi:hypothetical protein